MREGRVRCLEGTQVDDAQASKEKAGNPEEKRPPVALPNSGKNITSHSVIFTAAVTGQQHYYHLLLPTPAEGRKERRKERLRALYAPA